MVACAHQTPIGATRAIGPWRCVYSHLYTEEQHGCIASRHIGGGAATHVIDA
jgi:hypothetical protein